MCASLRGKHSNFLIMVMAIAIISGCVYWPKVPLSLVQVPAPPTLAAVHGGQLGQRYKEQQSTTCTRLLLLCLVTFSLWWSVAIGVSA